MDEDVATLATAVDEAVRIDGANVFVAPDEVIGTLREGLAEVLRDASRYFP